MMMKRGDPLSFCFVFYIDRLFMDWLLDLCEISSIYHNIFIKKYTLELGDRHRQWENKQERENGIGWTAFGYWDKKQSLCDLFNFYPMLSWFLKFNKDPCRQLYMAETVNEYTSLLREKRTYNCLHVLSNKFDPEKSHSIEQIRRNEIRNK